MIKCEFEDRGKTNLRHVVVDMLVAEGKKILLVKRAAHLSNGGKWALVGGYLDMDETLVEACVREAREETGFDTEVTGLFMVNDNPRRRGEDRQNVSFVFLVRPLEKKGKPDSEVSELEWFDMDSLPRQDEMAFDHLEVIGKYRDHLEHPRQLPIIRTSGA